MRFLLRLLDAYLFTGGPLSLPRKAIGVLQELDGRLRFLPCNKNHLPLDSSGHSPRLGKTRGHRQFPGRPCLRQAQGMPSAQIPLLLFELFLVDFPSGVSFFQDIQRRFLLIRK